MPDPKAIQAHHPEIANTLVACMEGIDIVNALALPASAKPEPASKPATISCPCLAHQALGRFSHRSPNRPRRHGSRLRSPAALARTGDVALKVLPFAAAMDPRHLQHFKNEAQAAAHGSIHTNIVPIFGVGCEHGVHYYAMQFIEGRTLAAVIKQYRRLLAGDEPTVAVTKLRLRKPGVPMKRSLAAARRRRGTLSLH